jgi:sortase A
VLTLVWSTTGLWAQYASDPAVAEFREARSRVLTFPLPDKSQWAVERARRYDEARWNFVPRVDAVMRIPALKLEVPVFRGATDLHMTLGAGHIDGTPEFGEPGNVAVSSHRDGYFRALEDIRTGDTVVVETRNATYEYVVAEILITSPTDTMALWPGSRPELTLVTCYPFRYAGRAPQRFLVRAELREVKP